ncbi:MAG: hypothetical protein EBS66_20500, partial [Betaproteobacteria bacterium]|nr:hypothetical protein [Betaproteobacteria bacterium]
DKIMNNHQYFAQIDNDNIVTNVAVVTQQFMQENPERYPGTWVETFVNLPNKTYAGIGFTWNGTDFVAPTADNS